MSESRYLSARIWCGSLILGSVCRFARPVLAQADPLSGLWVGGWVLEGTWTFASIDFSGSVLSQNGQWSGLSEMRSDAGRVRVRAGDLIIEGDLDQGQIYGEIHRGEASGTAYFGRLGETTTETFDAYVGTYRVSPDRWLLVTRTDGAKQTFYLDDGHQVPLFPLLDGRYFSQRGELIAFVRDAQPHASGLSIRRIYAPHLSAELYAPEIEPYAEEEAQFSSGAVTLAGTLLLPRSGGAHPALVLVHGAGALERPLYRVYADHFARQGIATLLYDRRGSGDSTGDPGEATLTDLAQDALAGVRLLHEHPATDPGQIGVWGISQGGRVVPIVAARSDQVAFVIGVSAPGMSQRAVQRWQAEQSATLDGQRVPDWGYSTWRFEHGLAQLWKGKTSNLNRDPAADWGQVRQPVLLVYGDWDRVVPVHDSTQQIVQALARGGHDDHTVRLLPGVDHNLMVSDAGAQPRLVPEALQVMSGWVLERSAHSGAFARLPGTPQVFELNASGEFGPWGRYGTQSAVSYILAWIGVALLCAVALAYWAWYRRRGRS